MRQTIHQYFMSIAYVVAERSTCDRKKVGAVIVKDGTILSTGFNGSMRKAEHCDDVGHLMSDGHCIRTVHAEMNAIAQAAKVGASVDGAAMYVTASPCFNCFKVIVNSGIKCIYFSEFYRDNMTIRFAGLLGIDMFAIDQSTGDLLRQ